MARTSGVGAGQSGAGGSVSSAPVQRSVAERTPLGRVEQHQLHEDAAQRHSDEVGASHAEGVEHGDPRRAPASVIG